MHRNDSLPALDSERGRGLSEIKGRDPMDRRVEVEKKERYAQELREQIAANSSRAKSHDHGGMPSTPILGSGRSSSSRRAGAEAAASSVIGAHMPDSSLHCSSSYAPYSPGPPRSDCHTPIVGGFDANKQTSDKVGQVQEHMRQRINAMQESQERQWQRIQAQLQDQQGNVHDLAEQAVSRQIEILMNSQVRPMLEEMAAARRDCEAQAARSNGITEDLGRLWRAVEELQARCQQHDGLLSTHSIDIEHLKEAHKECGRFRAEMQREQRSVMDSVAQLRAEQEAFSKRLAADLKNEISKIRSEITRIAEKAAQDFLGRMRPEPAPAPTPVAMSMPDVSEEAFAVLRNADGELYELPSLENSIGRSAGCHAVITHSQAISNRHASIDFDREGTASVRDLGSRNGLFLNEKRVPSNSGLVIQSGDSIQLGVDGPCYTFEFGPAYYARWPSNPVRVNAGGGSSGGVRRQARAEMAGESGRRQPRFSQ